MRKRLHILIAALALIFGVVAMVSGATYHWTNSQPANATYGPGDLIWLEGNWTNTGPSDSTSGLIVTNNGATGNPITFRFGTNASLRSPCFPSVGGIRLDNQTNIIIDGGFNGYLECTANGTGLTYTNSPSGIGGYPSGVGVLHNGMIINLRVTNIYNRLADSSEDNRFGYGIALNGSDIVISNCSLSDGDACLSYGASDVVQSNVLLLANNFYNFNHGMNLGIGDNNAYLKTLKVKNNYFNPSRKWNGAQDMHTDCIIVQNNAYSDTSIIDGAEVAYNFADCGNGNLGGNTTAVLFWNLYRGQKNVINSSCHNNLSICGTNNWSGGTWTMVGSNVWDNNNTVINSTFGTVIGTNMYFFNNCGSNSGVNLAADAMAQVGQNYTNNLFNVTNYLGGVWADFNCYFGPQGSFGMKVYNMTNNAGNVWNSGIFTGLGNWQTWQNNSEGYPTPVWNIAHADPHSTQSVPAFAPNSFTPATNDVVLNLTGTNLTAVYNQYGWDTHDYFRAQLPASGNWPIGYALSSTNAAPMTNYFVLTVTGGYGTGTYPSNTVVPIMTNSAGSLIVFQGWSAGTSNSYDPNNFVTLIGSTNITGTYITNTPPAPIIFQGVILHFK